MGWRTMLADLVRASYMRRKLSGARVDDDDDEMMDVGRAQGGRIQSM